MREFLHEVKSSWAWALGSSTAVICIGSVIPTPALWLIFVVTFSILISWALSAESLRSCQVSGSGWRRCVELVAPIALVFVLLTDRKPAG